MKATIVLFAMTLSSMALAETVHIKVAPSIVVSRMLDQDTCRNNATLFTASADISLEADENGGMVGSWNQIFEYHNEEKKVAIEIVADIYRSPHDGSLTASFVQKDASNGSELVTQSIKFENTDKVKVPSGGIVASTRVSPRPCSDYAALRILEISVR